MQCSITELTKKLIRCPSFSPKDAGCQELIIERLRALNFIVERMDINDTKNLWAWHGYGDTFVFAGHTDIVPIGDINHWINPPFEPVICNGMLFGRGAADMKGSLAAMIVATERFILQYPNHKNRLAFLITSDEEASAKNGTVKVVEELIRNSEHIEYCLVGEPSSIDTVGDVVKYGRRGSLTCNLTIHGIQGHVAYPHFAKNPVHLAAPMLNELVNIRWDHGNKFFPSTSMQITNLQSKYGNNNTIPGNLFMQFNFRYGTDLSDQIIEKRVKTLLKKYRLHYTIDWILSGKPFLTQNGKLIDVVIDTIKNYKKIKPKLLTTGGTSDGRFIAQLGAQIVELGPINATIHKINECVSIADLQLLALMYQRIIERLIL